MKTIQTLLIAVGLLISNIIYSQTEGMIKGSVTDSLGNFMPFVTVALMDNTTIVTGVTTDMNGDYTIKGITPGEYSLQFSYVGWTNKKKTHVMVDPSKVAYVNTVMKENQNNLGVVEVVETFNQTIINPTYTTMTPISLDQIENMPATRGDIISMIVGVTPGVLPTDDGKDLYVRGSRRGATQYIIDGNKVIGSPEVPALGIASMEVLTGGMPAEYGDCVGGIVVITTKEYKWEMRRKEMERRDREERQKKLKKK